MTRLARPTKNRPPSRARSLALGERLHALVPGGAHTYAKGDDQYPEAMAPVLVSGRGCHVRDADGLEYVEYGAGLRSVTLGHAELRVVRTAAGAMRKGTNFVRPTALEAEAAEDPLRLVDAAEMVKFAKNGSDVTTAATRLARAFTGRELVAVCEDQPFFSTHDWFIGHTAMPGGVPEAISDLTVGSRFNHLASSRALFDRYAGRVAAVVLKPATAVEPAPDFLAGPRDLCTTEGALLVFDEMITGFRWHLRGAQHLDGVNPDLSTFGKAMGNVFAMPRWWGGAMSWNAGGLRHADERVFLRSTTYGAETHALAAPREVMRIHEAEGVCDRLAERGERSRRGSGRWPRPPASPTTSSARAAMQPRLSNPRRRREPLSVVPDALPPGNDRPGHPCPVVRRRDSP
jgi:glutamate-1-semialdehyde 2,1-aminomutase